MEGGSNVAVFSSNGSGVSVIGYDTRLNGQYRQTRMHVVRGVTKRNLTYQYHIDCLISQAYSEELDMTMRHRIIC